MINRMTGVTLYHQIKADLKQTLANLPFDTQISTEEQLAAEYGVSRGTIRQAVNSLVDEGIVYKVQGKGTFKGGRGFQRAKFTLFSFTEQITALGMKPGICDLSLHTQPASAYVANYLKIEEGMPIHVFQRVRLANDERLALCTAYIRKDLLPDLKVTDLKMSLISMLIDDFGIQLQNRKSYCAARVANETHVKSLNATPGAPILRMEHTGCIETGETLFLDITDVLGNKYVLQVEQS